jgi:predicted transcriptional regulator of viral defense system
MLKIEKFLKQNNGYATMTKMKTAGIHPRDISNMVKSGTLEKVKTGLYRLSLSNNTEITQGFIDICTAEPKGVICLISAAEYYELITFNSSTIYLAIPRAKKAKEIIYPPVKFFYYSEKIYEAGVKEIITVNGNFKIYEIEKTICDLFRYLKRIGEDIAIEALKSYSKNKKKRKINKLLKYAKICKVYEKVFPLIKTLVHE